jgi:hypothetical protein
VPERIQSGDLYEDCRYHPMVCVRPSPPDDDELLGVSLIDGQFAACSEDHCGVVKLTSAEALARKVWFNRVADRLGWRIPEPRDAWADEIAESGEVAMPDAWHDMYERGSTHADD